MTTNFAPSIGTSTQWKKEQRSPNPGGRPKTRLLSEALRSRLSELKPGDPDGRTFAQVVAYNLINIASSCGPGAVTAAGEIADRLEGRPTQQLDFNDVTADLRNRTDEELQFHLDHDRWPNEQELLLLGTTHDGTE